MCDYIAGEVRNEVEEPSRSQLFAMGAERDVDMGRVNDTFLASSRGQSFWRRPLPPRVTLLWRGKKSALVIWSKILEKTHHIT